MEKPSWNTVHRHPGSTVGLAEFIHASYRLGIADSERLGWLAKGLGLVLGAPIKKQDASMEWDDSDKEQETPEGGAPTKSTVTEQMLSWDKKSEQSATSVALPALIPLIPVTHEPVYFEKKLDSGKLGSAIPLKPATADSHRASAHYQPLFHDKYLLGIASALLGAPMDSTQADIPRAAKRIAAGLPLDSLPMQQRRKLTRGVQVLADRSESMQPFWQDQTEWLKRLRRLLGESVVQSSWFTYEPLLPSDRQIDWLTPPPERFPPSTPVLLITDFGLGKGESGFYPEDWLAWLPLLQKARDSHSPLIALLPLPPHAWPAHLLEYVDHAVAWDRDSTPQQVARLCRK